MRVAFVSESSADESALHGFCESLLRRSIDRVISPVQIRRGWPALKSDLGPAIRAIRFKTDAELVVVVADSDGTEIRENAPTNRKNEIETVIKNALAGTNARPLRYALGLAVPCIEAWWLAHRNADINESVWLNRREVRAPYDKLELKRRLYGTDKLYLSQQTELMTQAAREAASHAELLSSRFPHGLAALIRELRT